MSDDDHAPQRLDLHLVARGFFKSRARAQEAVKAGLVRVNGRAAAKASQPVAPDADISIEGAVHPYVSRGGVKLDAALGAFGVKAQGATCLDLGASTGGFSDVLLRAGAAKIYAVDVGTGQLDKAVAADPRVVNMEKTHARDLTPALIGEPVDLLVCDVSFISLKKALPPALALCGAGAHLVALVKPQFEVGRAGVGKGGLVKPEDAAAAARDAQAWLDGLPGWKSLGLIESPIAGGDGNREFLLAGVKSGVRRNAPQTP